MISAIIYSSTTGSCKKYAEEMSRMLHIPAVDAKKNALPKGMEVIYVGWLLGGKVVGLAKVRKDYVVKAVVQVGMGGPNPKSEAVCREKNGLLGGVEVFTLQGRFDMDGLPLPLRLVMKAKCREIAARLRAKGELTEAEQIERQALREEYLAEWRRGTIETLESIRIERADGTIVPLPKKKR